MIALLLALQTVAIEEDKTAPLDGAKVRFVTATPQGKHLLIGEVGRVRVLDGETLERLDEIEMDVTAAGADAQERHLHLIGTSVLRLEARFRKESLKVELPETGFEKEPESGVGLAPQQAALGPDGRIYYRGTGDRLLVARWTGDGLAAEEYALPRRTRNSGSMRRILGMGTEGAVLIVDALAERGGVALPERGIFSLAGAYATLAAGMAGPRALLVMSGGEALYDSSSWRVQWERGEQDTRAAAFDGRNGWAFTAGPAGLRALRIADPERVVTLQGPADVRELAVDGLGKRLYAVTDKAVRSWKIKP